MLKGIFSNGKAKRRESFLKNPDGKRKMLTWNISGVLSAEKLRSE